MRCSLPRPEYWTTTLTSSDMSGPSTIEELLLPHDPQLPAILDVQGGQMTYGQLRAQVAATGEDLRRAGIGPGEPVALVLDTGPTMATVFVAVAGRAAAAPLHPGLTGREIRESLASLQARALVVDPGGHSGAAAAADDLGIQVLGIERTGPAGSFRLLARPARAQGHRRPARPSDTALLLHTSGTTARPKLVPLTQANLVASARSVAHTLDLQPHDRCLNIMPLFHIHGLAGVLLASLYAGSAVVAAPGFRAMSFFRWLDRMQPTWYSAVPTMHQTILQRAARNAASLLTHSLRLIRSSSAALPPKVFRDLEAAFGCPVIEAYGMTEAAHQMASNPLPPGPRKAGTVGVAAGPDVAVMDSAGNLLPDRTIGEVVIRGPNVTAGYVDNPEANTAAFTRGWFRTGDQGMRDADGYFTITGRLKELINRGGEKISPREVDEVLLEHPAVAQAVAFSVPHARLGEDVGAAIVLKAEAELTRRELREFAATRLAAYKVPRVVRFVPAIPKGPTGKLQRLGLASALGIGN